LPIRRRRRTRLLGTLLAVVGLGASGALLAGQTRQGVPAGRGTTAAPAPAGQRAASRGSVAPTGRPVRVLFLGMDEERPHNPATANEFKVEVTQPSHPVMQGVQSFTSFDEPYVHIKHNPQDRTVLMERPDPAGTREPWTWVRTQGQGRVFYTASGHDERTWDR